MTDENSEFLDTFAGTGFTPPKAAPEIPKISITLTGADAKNLLSICGTGPIRFSLLEAAPALFNDAVTIEDLQKSVTVSVPQAEIDKLVKPLAIRITALNVNDAQIEAWKILITALGTAEAVKSEIASRVKIIQDNAAKID